MALSQLSTPLTRRQARALVDAVMARDGLALSASAHEDEASGAWVFEATCEGEPDIAAFAALAAEGLGGEVDFTVEPIDPEIDWVARSLDGLAPVIAGGFFIHGSHEGGTAPAGLTPIEIDAARAFGTGHHETTTGCLEAIERVLKRRRPRAVLDVGTGTGVLAIALAKRRREPVLASDIDPIAARIAGENARRNGVGNLVTSLTANGLDHPMIAARGPYDLVVANILAGPLVGLAPAIGRLARRGAVVIVSGLLVSQAARVLSAYRAQGMVLERRITKRQWETLVLVKR